MCFGFRVAGYELRVTGYGFAGCGPQGKRTNKYYYRLKFNDFRFMKYVDVMDIQNL